MAPRRAVAWRWGVGLVLLLTSQQAGSQAVQEPARPPPTAPQAAPPPNAAVPTCFPSCREGFVCYDGRCISTCNPPCPLDQVCVSGRFCEIPLPGAARSQPIIEPPTPRQKAFDELVHSMVAFRLGLPGTFEKNGSEGALHTTYGFNLRWDSPIERYVLLGPLLQFGAWRPDATGANWNYAFDLALYVRGRIPISTPSNNFQIWAGVPIGVSFSVLGSDSGASGPGLGWNVGVLFGGAIHFSRQFGMFAEFGWLQHRFSHSTDAGQDLDFRLSQWNLNLGFVFRN